MHPTFCYNRNFKIYIPKPKPGLAKFQNPSGPVSLASVLEKSLELLRQPREKWKEAEFERLTSALKDLLEFQIFALTIICHWIASNPFYPKSKNKSKVIQRRKLDPSVAPLKSFQEICSNATLLESLKNADLFQCLPLLEKLTQIWKEPKSVTGDVVATFRAILDEMEANQKYSRLFICSKNCGFSFKTSLLECL